MSVKNLQYQAVSEKENGEDLKPSYEAPSGLGSRHLQVLVLFLTVTTGYALRAHMSVSVVAMTDVSSEDCDIMTNQTVCTGNCFITNETMTNDTIILENTDSNSMNDSKILFCRCCINTNSWTVYQTYNWSKSIQDMISYSFYLGYTVMMVPMGIMAQRFGGKIPLLLCIAVNSAVSIVLPWFPKFSGWIGICFLRLVQGCFQAALYPSTHTMLAKWAPLNERSRLTTFVYTGSECAVILGYPIAGYFAGSPSFGWPFSFWFFGIAGFISCGLLAWLVTATPQDHPTITTEELLYITGNGNANKSSPRKTPWKHILTSKPVWAMVITQLGSTTGYILVLTQTPTYLNNVLGVDVRSSGIYSSLPYIALYVMTLAFGYIADFLVVKNIMSIGNVRKVTNTIGTVVSGMFLVAFSYVDNTLMAIVLLIVCQALYSGVNVGHHINQIDLTPNFAGPVMALGNMFAIFTSLFIPVIIASVIKDDLKNQYRWQILFIIVVSFQVFTNMVYVLYGKGTVQKWNFYGEVDRDTIVERK
ncbi:putative inorganic phosphate cotransporter isoform X2 [Galleria mellonella]|uniref:Inorganic phosphate cotransporter isoform X2 n=1 Tax=Galleria mellonella TaxID=7137 RepID=A0ABM3M842_GALME|nr:putative inorganic phosphate cotransporter isoform X2 [Galleria mellonella]